MQLPVPANVLFFALGPAFFCSFVQAASVGEHPVENVIAMLKGLAVKVEFEAKQEAVAYDKFEHWCAVSTKTLNSAIAEEKETISALTSQISSEEKEIEQLNTEIGKLETEIAELGASQTAADGQRAEGRALYAQSGSDLNATIDAIAQAVASLKTSQGAGFSQMLSKPVLRKALAFASLDQSTSHQSAALLQQLLTGGQPAPAPAAPRPPQLAEGDYEAHMRPYNFKSGDIIELLKELQRKFEDELLAATKAETNAENAYALETQARTAATTAATTAKDEKTATVGDVSSMLAQHKNELQDEENELAADTATLSQTETACTEKAQEWKTRSDTRAKELEAMNTAVDILAKATGVRTEAPSNPVPPASPVFIAQPVSLLQVVDPRQRAVNLLRSKARTAHSHKLARMAEELAAHLNDPFNEVNNMIEKMIFRLMSEQTDEDNHKNWCDQELSKTNVSKINKEEKIEELTVKIDSAEATVQELATRITECHDMVAQLSAFAAEATEIREVGKKENAEALKDAQEAQSAVANAISVLEAFYKDSGMVPKEAWEFVQERKGVELPAAPATWGSSYTGVADPTNQPSGIIAVLEAVAADFAQMEAQTRAQEAQDQKEFDESMSATSIEKAERQKEADMKDQERKRMSDKLEANKEMRKHVTSELEAVQQYLSDLAPACLEGDSTYEARKAARTAEIAALKEAEAILAQAFDDKDTTSFLAVRRHRRN